MVAVATAAKRMAIVLAAQMMAVLKVVQMAATVMMPMGVALAARTIAERVTQMGAMVGDSQVVKVDGVMAMWEVWVG